MTIFQCNKGRFTQIFKIYMVYSANTVNFYGGGLGLQLYLTCLHASCHVATLKV